MSVRAVLRVQWLPGTDQLLGTCHCGARHRAQDPVTLWEWLHDHPDHAPGLGTGTGAEAEAEEDCSP